MSQAVAQVVDAPLATLPVGDAEFAKPARDAKRRSVRGGVTTVMSQALKFTVRTGSMMVMARLLSPEDFGLQGMVVAMSQRIADRRRVPDHEVDDPVGTKREDLDGVKGQVGVIRQLVGENRELFLEKWNAYFGNQQ